MSDVSLAINELTGQQNAMYKTGTETAEDITTLQQDGGAYS
jgi:hypothetical protein